MERQVIDLLWRQHSLWVPPEEVLSLLVFFPQLFNLENFVGRQNVPLNDTTPNRKSSEEFSQFSRSNHNSFFQSSAIQTAVKGPRK